MLRSLSRVWILMVLIVVVALGFGAKVYSWIVPSGNERLNFIKNLPETTLKRP